MANISRLTGQIHNYYWTRVLSSLYIQSTCDMRERKKVWKWNECFNIELNWSFMRHPVPILNWIDLLVESNWLFLFRAISLSDCKQPEVLLHISMSNMDDPCTLYCVPQPISHRFNIFEGTLYISIIMWPRQMCAASSFLLLRGIRRQHTPRTRGRRKSWRLKMNYVPLCLRLDRDNS